MNLCSFNRRNEGQMTFSSAGFVKSVVIRMSNRGVKRPVVSRSATALKAKNGAGFSVFSVISEAR